jgi:hypothetical protein
MGFLGSKNGAVCPACSLIGFLVAPFESIWLFSANTAKFAVEKKKKVPAAAAISGASSKATTQTISVSRAMANATGEDYEAWSHYLSHRDPRLRKPGMSVKEEYEKWMVARVMSRTDFLKS